MTDADHDRFTLVNAVPQSFWDQPRQLPSASAAVARRHADNTLLRAQIFEAPLNPDQRSFLLSMTCRRRKLTAYQCRRLAGLRGLVDAWASRRT